MNKHKIVFKSGTFGEKGTGLPASDIVTDFLVAHNLAQPVAGDCCNLLPYQSNMVVSGAGITDGALRISANTSDITASFASNTLTVTKPTESVISNLQFEIMAANVQATTDGSVTNWVKILLKGTASKGTTFSDIIVPKIQKVFGSATTSALSLTNFATVDNDNTPQVDIVGATATGDLTIRISGLSSVPASGVIVNILNIV